jgi:hypothetical protein
MVALAMIFAAEWTETVTRRAKGVTGPGESTRLWRHSERTRLVKAISVIGQGKPDLGA